MTIASRMRGALRDSMKARDSVGPVCSGTGIAQLTTGEGPGSSRRRGRKADARGPQGGQDRANDWKPEELALISEWLPANLTLEQIQTVLEPQAEAIRAAPKDGMAIGLAMKALAGQPIDSDDVRAAVGAIRGQTP